MEQIHKTTTWIIWTKLLLTLTYKVWWSSVSTIEISKFAKNDHILIKFWKQLKIVAEWLCGSFFVFTQKCLNTYQFWITIYFAKLTAWVVMILSNTHKIGGSIPTKLTFLRNSQNQINYNFFPQCWIICIYQMWVIVFQPACNTSELDGWGGSGCFF